MKNKDIGGGLIVIAIGLIFLAVNYGVMPAHDIGRLWPVILIVIGAWQLLFPDAEVAAAASAGSCCTIRPSRCARSTR